MRPSREEVLMEMAQAIAKRGTCDRKRVGAVIARDGRPLSVGFNGAPPGQPHCSENGHGWGVERSPGLRFMADNWVESAHLSEREMATMPWDWKGGTEYLARIRGCRNATHAEANALAFAAKYGIGTDRAQLFVTVAPCETCARLVIAAGIIEVCYLEAYRDPSGLELLKRAGLQISTILPDSSLQSDHSPGGDRDRGGRDALHLPVDRGFREESSPD